MPYNARDDIEAITQEKRKYDVAKAEGNQEGMNKAQANASGYYQNLRDNGQGELADQIGKSNAQETHNILDGYGKSGKVHSREYLSTALKKNGIDYDDSKVRWDADTNEVFYDGMSLGKTDYLSSDGKSYYEQSKIDDFAKSYAENMPISKENESGQLGRFGLETLEMWRDHTGSNLMDQAEANDILAAYDWDGTLAANNALADGAGDNSGNLDSFAAANAARQKQAYTSAAIDQILALGQWRGQEYGNIHAASLDQRAQVNAELNDANTRKNTDLVTEAEITGSIPTAYYTNSANNPYLNEDGTAKDYISDYSAEIDKVAAQLNDPSLSENTRRELQTKYNYLVAAREAKMGGSSVAKEQGSGKSYSYIPISTAAVSQSDADRELNRYNIDKNTELETALANAENDTERAKILFAYEYPEKAMEYLGLSYTPSSPSPGSTPAQTSRRTPNTQDTNTQVGVMVADYMSSHPEASGEAIYNGIVNANKLTDEQKEALGNMLGVGKVTF